ncbi:hypothetical protein DFS34DRAFT_630310 [Phlyctochytrium arcticum]|nr:hypothetical protein DFS34DRAFT_630310 [Phlyctochytrium arcticum]
MSSMPISFCFSWLWLSVRFAPLWYPTLYPNERTSYSTLRSGRSLHSRSRLCCGPTSHQRFSLGRFCMIIPGRDRTRYGAYCVGGGVQDRTAFLLLLSLGLPLFSFDLLLLSFGCHPL